MLKCPLDGHKQMHVHTCTDTQTHQHSPHQHTPLLGCGELLHRAGGKPATKARDKTPCPPNSNAETISPTHGLTGVSSLLPDNSSGANLQLRGAKLSLCIVPAKKPFLKLSSSREDTAEKPSPAQPGSLGASWTSPMTLPWVVSRCHGPT